MKKFVVILMLLTLVMSAMPAWTADRFGPGEVIYEDPAPPKK